MKGKQEKYFQLLSITFVFITIILSFILNIGANLVTELFIKKYLWLEMIYIIISFFIIGLFFFILLILFRELNKVLKKNTES